MSGTVRFFFGQDTEKKKQNTKALKASRTRKVWELTVDF